jgi:hypothetical protein
MSLGAIIGLAVLALLVIVVCAAGALTLALRARRRAVHRASESIRRRMAEGSEG